MVAAWWVAVQHLPLGNITAAAQASPLLTALLAKLILAEELSRYFLPCSATAALGIGCLAYATTSVTSDIAGPECMLGDCRLVGISAFVAAFLAMTLLPLTVRITRAAHWLEIEHVNAAASALVFTPAALIIVWFLNPSEVFDGRIYPWDASLLGGLSFLALCLQTRGFQVAEASVAAMMCYVQVPFSYILQFFVFNQIPSFLSAFGALCLVLAAVLNVAGASSSSCCAHDNHDATELHHSNANKILLDADMSS